MSGKCPHHKERRRKRIRACCAGFLIFIFIILFIILLIWAILQPKKPTFVLQDATLYAFNLSSPNFLTSNILLTIASRNPNDRVGIYYDKLDVYATYNSQQITVFTSIPAVYQGHKDVNVWSPMVTGTDITVSPYNTASIGQDQANGIVRLVIKIDGRVRFKVGSYISGKYHLHVRCPAYINVGGGGGAGAGAGGAGGYPNTGEVIVGVGIKYQLAQRCRVSI